MCRTRIILAMQILLMVAWNTHTIAEIFQNLSLPAASEARRGEEPIAAQQISLIAMREKALRNSYRKESDRGQESGCAAGSQALKHPLSPKPESPGRVSAQRADGSRAL
jgi:hypothetical protein